MNIKLKNRARYHPQAKKFSNAVFAPEEASESMKAKRIQASAEIIHAIR